MVMVVARGEKLRYDREKGIFTVPFLTHAAQVAIIDDVSRAKTNNKGRSARGCT